MNRLAEQIVKDLIHLGISLSVNGDGNLVLRGLTRRLTEEHRLDLRKHKPEIVHYLGESPITPVVMYVASDLECWTTDQPHHWTDKVKISGKEFVRLSPAVVAWFKQRIANAEAACAKGRLPLAQFTRILWAFAPVYDFAVRTGIIPAPQSNADILKGNR